LTPGPAGLSDSEKELLYKGPLLVCILMAGADGKIDNNEINGAVQTAKQQHWVKSTLSAFFQEVATDFEDKLKILIQTYPVEARKRNLLITEELRLLNNIWPKLEKNFGAAYYEMLKYLAHKIASSSGKFWAKITVEEAQLAELPMIKNPSKI
jgi:hypothetical protein